MQMYFPCPKRILILPQRSYDCLEPSEWLPWINNYSYPSRLKNSSHLGKKLP